MNLFKRPSCKQALQKPTLKYKNVKLMYSNSREDKIKQCWLLEKQTPTYINSQRTISAYKVYKSNGKPIWVVSAEHKEKFKEMISSVKPFKRRSVCGVLVMTEHEYYNGIDVYEDGQWVLC